MAKDKFINLKIGDIVSGTEANGQHSKKRFKVITDPIYNRYNTIGEVQVLDLDTGEKRSFDACLVEEYWRFIKRKCSCYDN
jgi:hypothetical protein